jgi:GT2 family glycosyltransferase
MQPLVTVNILSYNRKDDLRRTLQKVFEQEYKNIEVIVVDNDSIDGSVEMVTLEFPGVRLLVMQNNIGIAGWNEGAKIAKGEYLLLLDDDSYPLPSTLSIALQYGESENTIYALNVCLPDGNSYANYLQTEAPLRTFIGCGVLMRRLLFEKIGGFNTSLFLYYHELEFCLRAYQNSAKVCFVPKAIVIHVISPMNRTKRGKNQSELRRVYYFHRNIVYILISYFPLKDTYLRIIRFIFGHWLFAVFHSNGWITLKGISAGFHLAFSKNMNRVILREDVRRLYDHGRYFASFFGDGNFAFQRPHWLSRNSFFHAAHNSSE